MRPWVLSEKKIRGNIVSSNPIYSDNLMENRVKSILKDILGLSQSQIDALNSDSELFGAIPELDSMAVAGLLTEMEESLDIIIDDDDVDAELFETLGSLTAFAEAKANQ